MARLRRATFGYVGVIRFDWLLTSLETVPAVI